MRLSVSTHLQSVLILQTLAGRHSQIILTWSTNNLILIRTQSYPPIMRKIGAWTLSMCLMGDMLNMVS